MFILFDFHFSGIAHRWRRRPGRRTSVVLGHVWLEDFNPHLEFTCNRKRWHFLENSFPYFPHSTFFPLPLPFYLSIYHSRWPVVRIFIYIWRQRSWCIWYCWFCHAFDLLFNSFIACLALNRPDSWRKHLLFVIFTVKTAFAFSLDIVMRFAGLRVIRKFV